MTYFSFSVFSFPFLENSFSRDGLLLPIPSPQWEMGCIFLALAGGWHGLLQSHFLKNWQFSLKWFCFLKPLPWRPYITSLQFTTTKLSGFTTIACVLGCVSGVLPAGKGSFPHTLFYNFVWSPLGCNIGTKACTYLVKIPSPLPGSVSFLKKIICLYINMLVIYGVTHVDWIMILVSLSSSVHMLYSWHSCLRRHIFDALRISRVCAHALTSQLFLSVNDRWDRR